ncbi:MAG: sigma-54-dependent transcriptional regulator [Gammaproteobacteria bacterium]
MSPNQRILVIDDEPDISELLALTLRKMDLEPFCAASMSEARKALARQPFDLCLTDMRLPDGNGIDLVRDIQNRFPDLPVAVITAHGNMETAVESLKAGAFDFISKPVDLKNLRSIVASALRLTLPPAEGKVAQRNDLIGESAAIEETRAQIGKLARSQAPVYISGESGTGKELVARLIHRAGPRASAPFVPVNCGAIPAELMESEFFGHRKGSFTGATSDKDGLFQAASGGTLFLDEVGELPLSMQVKLLRAIQEKAVRRVGDQHETQVDVRILSATHADLGQLVEDNRFRQDFYYRINVIELHVPPLRERGDDVPLLAEHILRRLTQDGAPSVSLGDDALRALQRYDFPGNVRELENILERAQTLCDDELIGESDLRLPTRNPRTADSDSVPADLPAYLEEVERNALVNAMERARYNKTAAAKLLGISFRALRYRLKKLGFDDDKD